jgi:hypothetical protein
MENRTAKPQGFDGSYNFSTAVNHRKDDVWPPAPRGYQPPRPVTGNTSLTPGFTFWFFLNRFIVYGVGFGLCYGGGFGLLLFIIGAIYGAPIGALLGLALGVVDGLALGIHAARLIGRGVPAADAAKNVRILTPIISAIGGAAIAAVLFVEGVLGSMDPFNMIFAGVIWLIAIGASWHAATVFTRKFAQEYEC